MSTQFKYTTLKQAIEQGDVEEFKKMHKAGIAYHSFDLLSDLCSGYVTTTSLIKIQVIEYLLENGSSFDRCTVDSLAESGDIETLKYVLEKGAKFYKHTMYRPWKNGHLECLQFCVDYLGKLFFESNDKENFWCPVLEEDYIVDRIDFNNPNWKPLLDVKLNVDEWKDFWLENKKCELTEWPLITKKINEFKNQL